MKINGISSTTIAKLNGRTLGTADRLFNIRVDGAAVGGQTFSVVDYGADNTGTNDSTQAIIDALDAAGAAATEQERTIVYFPSGTYKVQPTGTLHVKIWENVSDTWTEQVADISSSTTYGTWHFEADDPTSGEGSDGDSWVNLTTGEVFTKASGTWTGQGEGSIINYSVTGLTASMFKPRAGSDGDLHFQLYVALQNVITLDQSHNFVTLRGELSGSTRLSTIKPYCWAGKDPMGYVSGNAELGENVTRGDYLYLRSDGKWWKTDDATATSEGWQAVTETAGNNAKVVVSSDILPDGYWDDTADLNSFRCHRGNCFVFDSDGSHTTGTYMRGVYFEDLILDGQCDVNYAHGYYNVYDSLYGWDINHKGIVWSWGGDGGLYDMRVTNCLCKAFRGEILYAGGSPERWVTITNTEVSHCNASAISISGQVNVDGCNLHHVYNGHENYASENSTQFSVVNNTTIDLSAGGSYGIVYIGGVGGNTYLHVKGGTTITGALGGVFLSDFADNVTIENTTITDCTHGVYIYYLNQYELAPHYDNISISNVSFVATASNVSNCIYAVNPSSDLQAENWTIDNASITEENGFNVTSAFLRDRIGGTNHDVTISNSDLSGVVPWTGEGVAPVWTNVTTDAVQIFSFTTGDWQWTNIGAPRYKVTHVGEDAQNILLEADATDTPVGFTLEVSYRPNSDQTRTAVLPVDTAWNAFSSAITLDQYDAVNLTFNANGKWELVSFEDEKYAP